MNDKYSDKSATATLEKSKSKKRLDFAFESEVLENAAGDKLRLAAATVAVELASVKHNLDNICTIIDQANASNVDLLHFSDFPLSAATCADLFFHKSLQEDILMGLGKLLHYCKDMDMIISLSLPLPLENKLLKVTVLIKRGQILTMLPQEELSRSERRYFSLPCEFPDIFQDSYYYIREKEEHESDLDKLLFHLGREEAAYVIAAKDSLSSGDFAAEAENEDIELSYEISLDDLIDNSYERQLFYFSQSYKLSEGFEIFNRKQDIERDADNNYGNNLLSIYLISETRPEFPLAYEELRQEWVKQSTNEAVVVYASAGLGESTAHYVYAGHRFIAFDGALLTESEAYTTGLCLAEIDFSSYHIEIEEKDQAKTKVNYFSAFDTRFENKSQFLPYLPANDQDWRQYAYEMLDIQARGLATRMQLIKATPVIGLSGGIDSTLALLVCLRACRLLELPADNVLAVSMPGPGSSERSTEIASALAKSTGITLLTIPIDAAVMDHLQAIGHDGKSLDASYENAQARERTQILMDLANLKNGLVIGCSDLSELALGFCTYNGDQMSMYAVNHSVLKTVARLTLDVFSYDLKVDKKKAAEAVEFLSMAEIDHLVLSDLLDEILDRPISPELLPPSSDDTIIQKTEKILGPYEINDFFLYHLIFNKKKPLEVYKLASMIFTSYEEEVILKLLKNFIKRFFQSQFKRQPMPEGVQATPYSLSPHGAYVMPGDVSAQSMLDDLP